MLESQTRKVQVPQVLTGLDPQHHWNVSLPCSQLLFSGFIWFLPSRRWEGYNWVEILPFQPSQSNKELMLREFHKLWEVKVSAKLKDWTSEDDLETKLIIKL